MAASMPLVGVAVGKDYGAVTAEAVILAGGLEALISTGDTVVIKPNIGWDRAPEQGANTHPAVVKRLAELALDLGAKEIKVFDYTCNEKRRCYHNSGIAGGLAEIGDKRIKLSHIDHRKFIPVDIEQGKSLKRWEIYRDAITADCYINVPVAKHHGLSRLSLGLKNSMGVIGGRRGKLHHNLGQELADLATVVRAQLTVIDATRLLQRSGPQGGRVEDVEIADTVIASTDPVAADAYATTLFALPPEAIGSTVAAHAMGLGEMDIGKMQIKKSDLG
jgi:uncharacterized protein (DUF362 family)